MYNTINYLKAIKIEKNISKSTIIKNINFQHHNIKTKKQVNFHECGKKQMKLTSNKIFELIQMRENLGSNILSLKVIV